MHASLRREMIAYHKHMPAGLGIQWSLITYKDRSSHKRESFTYVYEYICSCLAPARHMCLGSSRVPMMRGTIQYKSQMCRATNVFVYAILPFKAELTMAVSVPRTLNHMRSVLRLRRPPLRRVHLYVCPHGRRQHRWSSSHWPEH